MGDILIEPRCNDIFLNTFDAMKRIVNEAKEQNTGSKNNTHKLYALGYIDALTSTIKYNFFEGDKIITYSIITSDKFNVIIPTSRFIPRVAKIGWENIRRVELALIFGQGYTNNCAMEKIDLADYVLDNKPKRINKLFFYKSNDFLGVIKEKDNSLLMRIENPIEVPAVASKDFLEGFMELLLDENKKQEIMG